VLSSFVVSLQEQIGWWVWRVAALPTRATAGCSIAALIAAVAAGCIKAPETALERLMEARRLGADLLVQLTKAADASNRAVMADTDEASIKFAREAEQATQAVQTDTDALRPILQGLDYANETRLLDEFNNRFGEYRALDRSILELAVENTNLKAQGISFGPAQEAADAFRDSLAALAPLEPAKDSGRVEALVATAVADVREIQVLQAPHIAEPDEAAMTRLEKRMAASEAAARSALKTLAGLVQSASRPKLAAANAALDRFTGLNAEIIALSRRNTNVRSLALSLGKKRTLTSACEDSVRALQDALTKREFKSTR
jgi:hypothetical protein